jgi:hypothetical protein
MFNVEETEWQNPAPETVDTEWRTKAATQKCVIPKKMEINNSIAPYGTLTRCEGCGTAKAKQKAVSKTTNVKFTRSGEIIFLDVSGLYHETLGGASTGLRQQ